MPDGYVGHGQAIGDLLVALAVSHEAENFQLAWREVLFAQVFRNARGHRGRHPAPALVNRSDSVEQFMRLREKLSTDPTPP